MKGLKSFGRLMLATICATVLWSCGNNDAANDKISQLTAQNDSLRNANNELGQFITFVSESMDSMMTQESVLLNHTGENPKGIKEQIKDNLRVYESLLERQRQRLTMMQDSLKNANGANISRFKKIIEGLEKQIEEKDQMIAQLKQDLESKNIDISNLKSTVTSLNSTVADLEETNMAQVEALEISTNMLNTAYIKVGTKKELENAGLLVGGGFLKKKKLDVSSIDTSKLQAVDIRNFHEITINGKKPKILTQMPESSYRLENTGNQTKLIVVDPTQFWSISNVLIIQY